MATEVNHDERRQMVVVKALGLFAKMGYAKVSFLAISEATGIARTALYRYFKTKREIFDAAIHSVTSVLVDELNSICVKGLPVPRRIEQSCLVVMEAIRSNKEFFYAICDFVFSMVRTGENMTSRIEMFTGGFRVILQRLVAEGVQNGELKSNIDPESAAETFFALMESFAFRVLLGTEVDIRAARRRFKSTIQALEV
jgi:AcrR family transcriptional regulator